MMKVLSEGENMKTTKIDLKTAKWLVDEFDNIMDKGPFEMEECAICGSMYLPELGHSCGESITVPVHSGDEGDEK